jgi:hypothetical protein
MTEKKLNVVFAPGCFDDFEGTQDELDDLIKQITETFSNLTPEQLESSSRTLTDDDISELCEEFQDQPELLKQIVGGSNRLLN